MNFFINIVAGSLVSWFAFKAVKAGNITAALVLSALYIFITFYFN